MTMHRIERSGPRPLLLHLAQARAAWGGPAAGPAERRLFEDFLAGVVRYREHPFRRPERPLPVAWSAGATRLLDCGQSTGPPLLVVPSLINRAHILDLLPECSLLAHLAGERFRPFLLDWGEPGPLERRMTLEQHITDRLGAGAAWLTAESGAAPVVIGYCMGGTLALGFAAAMRPRISGLALLATPFDFHAAGLDGPGYQALVAGPSALLAGAWGGLPVDLIQALFAGIDPLEVPRKFARFARLDPAGLEARRFVAVEDWLNDGVPLGAEVADACLSGWYGENRPASGRWRIDGRAVRAEEVRVPTFLAVPTRDRIVPPASAEALAGRLGSRPTVVRPAGGHIGMVVGVRGTSSLWSPLVAWLREVAALQKGAC